MQRTGTNSIKVKNKERRNKVTQTEHTHTQEIKMQF